VETRAPRRRLGRAERERQILDAAVRVFSERGFQQASMDAVAKLVGVTKPVLYTHFGSKDGLLLACIARARAELSAGKPDVERQRVEGWAQIIVGATERLALWRGRGGGGAVSAEQATEYLMDLAWTGLQQRQDEAGHNLRP
jgi:hypothetical protein